MKTKTYLIREWEEDRKSTKFVPVEGVPVRGPIGGYRWFTHESGTGYNITEETSGFRAVSVGAPTRAAAINKLKTILKKLGYKKFSGIIETCLEKYGPVKLEPA